MSSPQKVTPEPTLTLEQQIRRLRFQALIADNRAADAQYDALPETREGRIISTDFARFLDDGYRVHLPGTLRDITPSWEDAWRYAQDRLEREIRRRQGRKLLRLMAGGWAAGKTYALQRTAPADLNWDGTLVDTEWARRMIKLALSHGWRVHLAYVHRPVELACWGALQRGIDEGRMVPLLALPALHAEVQASVLKLAKEFQKKAEILLLYNAGSQAAPQIPFEIDIADIAPGGRLHYSSVDVEDLEEKARSVWQEASRQKVWPQAVLDAAGSGMD
ncbi:MAG: zeta toxin family protein [Prosthecobacter sp.]|uniref:zeta toxin family protein n=1 Tax=Prosthecobacter sp. TaxID=1965333 RepID=UPI003BB0E38D